MESIMSHAASPSPSVKDSSPASAPIVACAAPDARAARDPSGHFTQGFRLAAVRYAAACGKSQRAAARDVGISDRTLSDWSRDARPDAVTGVIDAARFDELAQLRAQNRELLAQAARLTAARDFLKKCASYFASTPANGGSR
jgi:transposase-like protein